MLPCGDGQWTRFYKKGKTGVNREEKRLEDRKTANEVRAASIVGSLQIRLRPEAGLLAQCAVDLERALQDEVVQRRLSGSFGLGSGVAARGRGGGWGVIGRSR